MATFELLVDGERYGGWQSIRLSRGLERAAADFTLTVSERWPLQEQPESWQVQPGMRCQIFINDEQVLTGWVDAYRPNVAADSHQVQIVGRSKTCDFVDSSITIDGGEFKGLTVLEIARKLAEPFDIEVIADVPSDEVRDTTLEDELTAEPETQCQPSESCFDFVERLARLQELLITDDEDGRLVLTRAGNKKASDKLVQGENVKSASAKLDDSKRFSHYIVKAQRAGNRTADKKSAKGPWWQGALPGQFALIVEPNYAQLSPDACRAAWRAQRLQFLRPGPRRDVEHAVLAATADVRRPGPRSDVPDWQFEWEDTGDVPDWVGGGTDTDTDRGAKALTQIIGQARDEGITRYRPKVIIAEAQADDANSSKRADWEMRRRFAKSREATVTVNGWHQSNGDLWRPNLMVQTTIPWLSLDMEMIISAVDYVYGEEGELCTFTLTLPDAFLPEKFRKAKKKKKGKGKPAAWYSGMVAGQ